MDGVEAIELTAVKLAEVCETVFFVAGFDLFCQSFKMGRQIRGLLFGRVVHIVFSCCDGFYCTYGLQLFHRCKPYLHSPRPSALFVHVAHPLTVPVVYANPSGYRVPYGFEAAGQVVVV